MKRKNGLFGDLQTLNQSLQQRLKKKWNRNLPFQDALFDRWERAESLGFGKEASIYNSSLVFGDVTVGKHTWIGPFCILDGKGKLTIGDFCSVSSGVQIYTHDSLGWALSGGKMKYPLDRVSIGNRCYLGPHAVVTRGVSLGDGCVVAAHSMVNRSFPRNTIVAGAPAKKIGAVVVKKDGIVLKYKSGRRMIKIVPSTKRGKSDR